MSRIFWGGDFRRRQGLLDMCLWRTISQSSLGLKIYIDQLLTSSGGCSKLRHIPLYDLMILVLWWLRIRKAFYPFAFEIEKGDIFWYISSWTLWICIPEAIFKNKTTIYHISISLLVINVINSENSTFYKFFTSVDNRFCIFLNACYIILSVPCIFFNYCNISFQKREWDMLTHFQYYYWIKLCPIPITKIINYIKRI